MQSIENVKSYLKEITDVSSRISKEKKISIVKLSFDIVFCALKYAASPNNYEKFEFYNLNRAQRKTYVTYGVSRNMIKKCNNTPDIVFLEDKIKFAQTFSDMFNRGFLITDSMTLKEFKNFCKGKEKFILKPVGGAQGMNIKVFHLGDADEIYAEIKENYGHNYILEEWIEQHSVLSEIYPNAVNCLRIITVFDGQKANILTGGITFSIETEIANASQPAIVAPVNFETGVMDKPAATFGSPLYTRHPHTNAQIQGVKVPYWDQVLELVNKACARVPTVRYIGWDIAITPNGPILIEGNTTPGYKYYQIPSHLEDKCGNKPIYDKYLQHVLR